MIVTALMIAAVLYAAWWTAGGVRRAWQWRDWPVVITGVIVIAAALAALATGD